MWKVERVGCVSTGVQAANSSREVSENLAQDIGVKTEAALGIFHILGTNVSVVCSCGP